MAKASWKITVGCEFVSQKQNWHVEKIECQRTHESLNPQRKGTRDESSVTGGGGVWKWTMKPCWSPVNACALESKKRSNSYKCPSYLRWQESCATRSLRTLSSQPIHKYLKGRTQEITGLMQLVPFWGCKVLKIRGMRQLDSYNVRQGMLDHLKDRDKETLREVREAVWRTKEAVEVKPFRPVGKGRFEWSPNDGVDLARKKGTRCFKIGWKVRRGLCERANEEENAKKTIWMVCRKLSAQIRCSDITSQDSGELVPSSRQYPMLWKCAVLVLSHRSLPS